MKRTILTGLLLGTCLVAFGQFNTIRTIKVLPTIEMDTATAPTGTALVEVPVPQEPAEPAAREAFQAPAPLPPLAGASMPLGLALINSGYGNRLDPFTGERRFHGGIDFVGKSDTALAILPGAVLEVGYDRALGLYVVVGHGEYSSIYGHLSAILVREGQPVVAGEALAITGSTGRSTGEHLHFALKHRGRIVNPTPYLDAIYRELVRPDAL